MNNIIDAIQGRQSVRAFLPKAVSDDTVKQILAAARWAPSGVNTQPWQVAVISGATQQRIVDTLCELHRQGVKPNPDYQYYPSQWHEPYKGRRFACGMALYGALDIQREDKARRAEVWQANYRFFDAPLGLFFLIDADLEKGSWMDMGMFIQNVMLAARGLGLETCPQAALAEYPDAVRDILQLPSNIQVICGMAVGYADWQAPINQYRTERTEVNEFTRWYQ